MFQSDGNPVSFQSETTDVTSPNKNDQHLEPFKIYRVWSSRHNLWMWSIKGMKLILFTALTTQASFILISSAMLLLQVCDFSSFHVIDWTLWAIKGFQEQIFFSCRGQQCLILCPLTSGTKTLAAGPLSPVSCEVGPPWIRLVFPERQMLDRISK